MISLDNARALREYGVPWTPTAGDRFTLGQVDLMGQVFWISDLTIEVHEYHDEKILGFNGTTEWALDSVPLDAAIWLPREDQLRALVGEYLIALSRQGCGWVVTIRDERGLHEFEADDAEDAYAAAVLARTSAPAATER